MTDPDLPFDINNPHVTDVPDFAVPNPQAGSDEPIILRRDSERKTRLRDVISGNGGNRRTPASKPVKPREHVPNKPGQFVEPLTAMYAGIGAMVFPADNVCGTAIISNAEQCAKSLDELAQKNETVRRALKTLTTGTAWGAVVVAHTPILLAVMSHHSTRFQSLLGSRLGDMAESWLVQTTNPDTHPQQE